MMTFNISIVEYDDIQQANDNKGNNMMTFISHCKIPFLLVLIMLASLSHAQTVWIDVRSAEEHAQDHIAGDARISHSKIASQINALYPDKNTEIHVYCRSGRRAGIAQSVLQEAGYNNVHNAGSIDDARKERTLDQAAQPCC